MCGVSLSGAEVGFAAVVRPLLPSWLAGVGCGMGCGESGARRLTVAGPRSRPTVTVGQVRAFTAVVGPTVAAERADAGRGTRRGGVGGVVSGVRARSPVVGVGSVSRGLGRVVSGSRWVVWWVSGGWWVRVTSSGLVRPVCLRLGVGPRGEVTRVCCIVGWQGMVDPVD